MNEDKQEIIDFYDMLLDRITDGSASVIFNQASDMIFQLETMVSYGFPPESIVEFVREYKDILYDIDDPNDCDY